MAALFQSSADNTAKLPINSAKTIILEYPSLLIIQYNLQSLLFTIAAEKNFPLARIIQAMEQASQDLAVVSMIVGGN